MKSKKVYESVSINRSKDYPFENRVKKPYFVKIDDGNDVFYEQFNKKQEAITFAEKLKTKSKIYKNLI